MPTQTQLVSGLAGAIGSDFRRAQNQLVFVEYGGKLSRLNLIPSATVLTSGSTTLLGSYGFNLDTGVEDSSGAPLTGDVWWSGFEPYAMARIGAAQLANLGVTDFSAITAATLQSLTYSTANVPASSFVNGDVLAVQTNGGNYAKVLVVSSGYNMEIQWVTYQLDPAYKVLGTGYNSPEDVKVSSDGLHVYVTERTGDLLQVAFATPNRGSATVIASGMTAPQQMFLDEAHGNAYAVEYAPAGNLWQINLSTGTKTALLTGLQNAVGVVISSDLQYAYISEQTTGPDSGRVSRFQLSSGTRQGIVTGLTAPFFLTWFDAAQTSILVPERDPVNDIQLINVAAGTSQVVVSGVPNRPSSVTSIGSGVILIATDETIDEADFLAFQPAGPLLMGIGFIPFDKVITSGTLIGLADTTVDPTYFYQVKDTPFGGQLPITLNYMRALNDGAAYYQVYNYNSTTGFVSQNITWTDEHWNGFEYVAQTTGPVSVGGQPGYYPIRALSDLFLWLNPALGGFIQSTDLPDGLNTIWIVFVDGLGNFVEIATPLTILVDNNSCTATIGAPTLHGVPADPVCGVLYYGIKDTSLVTIPFTASQPENFATFSVSAVKGANPLNLPPLPISGLPVTDAPGLSPIAESVADLLGTCTIAAFAVDVYVAATANNGWGRQSQYDAEALTAFVLAP